MRSAGRPAGTPIGRSLDVPAGIAYDELREAIAAIDRVHGDGALPPIPVRLVPTLSELGRFRFDSRSGEPISLLVRSTGRFGRFALIHEVGHYLDWTEFGERRDFGSSFNPSLGAWNEEVIGSRAYRLLRDLMRLQNAVVTTEDCVSQLVPLTPKESRIVGECLLPEECWARSYAQYIATRSRRDDLRASVDSFRYRRPARVYLPVQWDEDDFMPIAREIDVLFHDLGWRT